MPQKKWWQVLTMAVDLHVRAQHFRHTPWTRGDPNKGEHSKSKDKGNCVCPHSYKVTENR